MPPQRERRRRRVGPPKHERLTVVMPVMSSETHWLRRMRIDPSWTSVRLADPFAIDMNEDARLHIGWQSAVRAYRRPGTDGRPLWRGNTQLFDVDEDGRILCSTTGAVDQVVFLIVSAFWSHGIVVHHDDAARQVANVPDGVPHGFLYVQERHGAAVLMHVRRRDDGDIWVDFSPDMLIIRDTSRSDCGAKLNNAQKDGLAVAVTQLFTFLREPLNVAAAQTFPLAQ